MTDCNGCPRSRVFIIAALLALVLGLVVAIHFYHKKSMDRAVFHGTLLESPRVIQPFSLRKTDKTVFNNQSLKGKWTLIFFGFTRCGSICPTIMSELNKTYKILKKHKVRNMPEIVMISLDPARDSLANLGQYVQGFNPNFFGARGKEAAIKRMTAELGIAYAKIPIIGEDINKNYNLSHSGALMLFNPNGDLVAFFTTPHHAYALARDYELLLAAY